MTILGHKITNIQMAIQICTWGTYKYLLWCSESKIWVLRFQMCDLGIFGLFVAFLVFMALKVKLKTLAEFSKPFDHIMAKKYIKNHCFAIWSLMWPSKIFLAFFIYSEIYHVLEVYLDAIILYISSLSFQRVSGSNFSFPIIVSLHVLLNKTR